MDNLLLIRRAIAPKEYSLSGAMPLSFDARRMPLKSLVREGKCEQRNLPQGYTELEYINPYSSAGVKIDLGIKDDVDDMVYEIWCTPCLGSWCVLQSREYVGAPVYGITGSASGNTIQGACRGYPSALAAKNGTPYARITTNPIYVRYTHKNGHHDIYVKDLTTGEEYTAEDDSNAAYVACTTNIFLFGNSVSAQYITNNPTTHARLTKSGVVVRDLYPANDGTNNGFYDKASGQMFLPVSQSSIRAGSDLTPTPERPMDIWCNNGVLRYSRNLLDPSADNIIIGEFMNTQGESAIAGNNWRTDYIPVVGGKTYIFYGRKKADNVISAYCRMNFYTADKTHITPRPSYTKNTPTVGTAPSNAAYVRLSCAPYNSSSAITRETFDEFNWMFVAAAQEIPYQPYVEGGIYTDGTPEVIMDALGNTAGAANLLGVGNYADTQEVISGLLTNKVGVKVFDGTEDWKTLSNSRGYYNKISEALGVDYTNSLNAYCSHFSYTYWWPQNTDNPIATNQFSMNATAETGTMKVNGNFTFRPDLTVYDTVNKFKQYLADQYAAGAPVIILFPLATPTTESVTPQALNSAAGGNTISSTANVQSPQATVKYYK